AFFRWVALGHSKHFQMSTGDGLNQVLATMLFIRDEPGKGSYDEQGAHGSAFDRVYALQTGFADGTKRCARIDKQDVDARVTQDLPDEQDVAGGNLALDQETIGLLKQSLETAFSRTGTPAPEIVVGDGRCAGGSGTPPASFCQDGNTVNIDLARLRRYGTPPGPDSNIAYGEGGIGDFAPFAEIASRYAMAVQHHLGIPLDDARAGLRTTCLTGAWAGFAKKGGGDARRRLLLSPGDLDEAIAELLTARSVISADDRGDRVKSGFARIEAFRLGYLTGSQICTDRFR
ncbi:MAG: neutral zinc metallopeptidase, partial [Sciscionella sp.]